MSRGGICRTRNATAPAAYFETELPDRFLAAIAALHDRFDAIVVDEGQDFADVWWVTLEELLRDPKNSALYIFYDQDQVIYRNRGAFPIPEPHFQLLHNCRSTRAIQVAAGAYTPNPDRGEPRRGPAESPDRNSSRMSRGIVHDRSAPCGGSTHRLSRRGRHVAREDRCPLHRAACETSQLVEGDEDRQP